MWTIAVSGKKKLRIQKYPDTCGRGLTDWSLRYWTGNAFLSQKKRYAKNRSVSGCVFTTLVVSLNIPEGVMFTDNVKRIKNDMCFHEEDYISLW